MSPLITEKDQLETEEIVRMYGKETNKPYACQRCGKTTVDIVTSEGRYVLCKICGWNPVEVAA